MTYVSCIYFIRKDERECLKCVSDVDLIISLEVECNKTISLQLFCACSYIKKRYIVFGVFIFRNILGKEIEDICFFLVKDRNLFHLVDTIGNIFTSGAATSENITDGVHEMK